jgi:DNA mismatch repair protein MutL
LNARAPIRRLDPDLVGRIAAGEVIERPASVVKELVENCFDAGATRVTVRVEEAGLRRIEVADDGAGIVPEELPLALERHATSKLPEGTDLSAIATLGFRGEALASIAAVAHVTLLSRVPESDVASGVEVEGGTLSRSFEGARAPGTTVTVADLFFNLPARRKFLRSPAAEQVEITTVLGRLHLAHPEVALTLESQGVEVARYPGTSSLREAAGRVLGREFSEQSFAVHARTPGVAVEGWLGRPPLSRSTSGGLYLSINGRAVLSRALNQAVRVAFADYLPRARYPLGALQLEIDLSRVDVNVHPSKREVRIARESEVADALREAVRRALLAAPQEAERPVGATGAFAMPPAELDGGAGDSMPAAEPSAEPELVSAVFAPAVRQTYLVESAPLRRVAGSARHPPLTLLGCLGALYWVASSGEDGVLVDQHAASERVLYEELRVKGRLARQELVSPSALRLSARQVATLRAETAAVAASGFVVEPFGPDAWRVHAVPSYRGRRAPVEELPRLLDELAEGGRPSVPDGLAERVAASIACHAAVRGGDVISSEEMGRVLEALYALSDAAFACPHGRPILVRLPRRRLDRWFGRSGA